MKKIFTGVMMLIFLTATSTAAIDEVSVVNVFPDEESTERNTQVVGRFDSDSTTTTMASLYVQSPNGTTILAEEINITVKKGAPLEREFTVNGNLLKDFGEYKFKINQTNNQINDSFNFTIQPQPQVELQIGDLVKDPSEENLDYFHANVNPSVGRTISDDDLQDQNLTVYRITSNKTTPTGVQKELVETLVPGISNQTGDFEAVLDFTGKQEGTYAVVLEFNISTCASCPRFNEREATSIRVRNSDINTMADELTMLLAAALAMFAMFYAAFNIGNRGEEKRHGILRVFFLGIGFVFMIGTVWIGGVASRTGSGIIAEAATGMNGLLYAVIFTFFTYLLYLVIVYIKNAVMVTAGEEFDEEL